MLFERLEQRLELGFARRPNGDRDRTIGACATGLYADVVIAQIRCVPTRQLDDLLHESITILADDLDGIVAWKLDSSLHVSPIVVARASRLSQPMSSRKNR